MKKTKAVPFRAHLFYTGRVQGIGFRYTAEALAISLDLLGWVKNISDGRVEIVCEGPKDKIEAFLEKIQKSHLGPHIKKKKIEWETPKNEFTEFSVEFCL